MCSFLKYCKIGDIRVNSSLISVNSYHFLIEFESEK
jgi:hypothetical protein